MRTTRGVRPAGAAALVLRGIGGVVDARVPRPVKITRLGAAL